MRVVINASDQSGATAYGVGETGEHGLVKARRSEDGSYVW